MAELTHLDEKLAEVLGLAQAAQTATNKVATLARQEEGDRVARAVGTDGRRSGEGRATLR